MTLHVNITILLLVHRLQIKYNNLIMEQIIIRIIIVKVGTKHK